MERKILVQLEYPLKVPDFVGQLIGDKVQAEATATITDPVEFIRTVDLVALYGNRIKTNISMARQALEKQKGME